MPGMDACAIVCPFQGQEIFWCHHAHPVESIQNSEAHSRKWAVKKNDCYHGLHLVLPLSSQFKFPRPNHENGRLKNLIATTVYIWSNLWQYRDEISPRPV